MVIHPLGRAPDLHCLVLKAPGVQTFSCGVVVVLFDGVVVVVVVDQNVSFAW